MRQAKWSSYAFLKMAYSVKKKNNSSSDQQTGTKVVVINEDHDGILANNYKILILLLLVIRDGNSTRRANIVNTAISAQLQISGRCELAPLLGLKIF